MWVNIWAYLIFFHFQNVCNAKRTRMLGDGRDLGWRVPSFTDARSIQTIRDYMQNTRQGTKFGAARCICQANQEIKLPNIKLSSCVLCAPDAVDDTVAKFICRDECAATAAPISVIRCHTNSLPIYPTLREWDLMSMSKQRSSKLARRWLVHTHTHSMKMANNI